MQLLTHLFATELAHCVLALLAALVLGICALWLVSVRRRQRQREIGQSSAVNKISAPVKEAVDVTATTLRRRQLMHAHAPLDTSRPADEAGPLQRFVAGVLRCTCFDKAHNEPVVTHLRAAPKKAPPPPPTSLLLPAAPTGPPPPSPLPSSSDATARLASELCTLQNALADLRLGTEETHDDAWRHEVERISDDLEWLQCFWLACDRDVPATTALVRSYAASSRSFQLDKARVADILSAGLIDILPDNRSRSGHEEEVEEDHCAVVAVVRDIQVIAELLQAYSFRDVVAAHLVQLERLLRTSARARRYGVSMVHDLSGLSWALVRSMLTPNHLAAQLQGAQFLFTAFPVHFDTIVVVDAPPAFAMLLNAVKAVAPGAIPEPLHFVERPEATAHLERVFRGQPIRLREMPEGAGAERSQEPRRRP